MLSPGCPGCYKQLQTIEWWPHKSVHRTDALQCRPMVESHFNIGNEFQCNDGRESTSLATRVSLIYIHVMLHASREMAGLEWSA